MRGARLLFFVLIGLCFLLTFVQVSCAGQRIATFSGVQLVTGTKVVQQAMFGERQVREVKPEPFAVVAAFAVLAGLFFSLAPGRAGNVLPALACLVGLTALLLLMGKLQAEAAREASGVLEVTFGPGFMGAAVLLLLGGVCLAVLALGKGDRAAVAASASATYCPECGALVKGAFCSDCGARAS